jgi:plasmid stability protein
MKQLKVSLSDDLLDELEETAAKTGRSLSEEVRLRLVLLSEVRTWVEAAANKAGHSVAEEIKQRLQNSLADDQIDPETRRLMNAVRFLASLISIQTRHKWYSHPAAASVMKHAIDAQLAHFRGGDGEAQFTPDELPPKESRWLPLPDDSRGMGVALATAAGLGERLGMVNLPPIAADAGKKSPRAKKGGEQ